MSESKPVGPVSAPPNQDKTVQYYWDMVTRRHWLLLGVFAAVSLAVFTFGARQRPVYQSSATLLVSQEGAAQDPLSLFSAAAGGLAKRPVLVNHIEMLKSYAIAQLVYQSLGETDQAAVRRETRADPALTIQRGLTVRPVRDADIISLSVRAPSPVLARTLAAAYVAAYRAFNLDRSRADISAIKDFVGVQLEVVGARLDSAELRLQEYKQANSITDLSEETRATVDRQTQVLALYEQTRSEREGVERELGYVSERLDSAGAGKGIALDDISSPMVASLGAELSRLEAERTGLLVNGYSATSFRIKALSERIGQMKSGLESELSRFVRSPGDGAGLVEQLHARAVELEPERQRLRASEATLAGVVESYDGTLRSLPSRERSLARLQRNVEVDRQVHMLLAQRYEESRIQEAGRLSTVGVIDAPVDGVKTRPNHRNNAIMALLLGLALAFATIFAADYIDTTVRRPEDMERQGFAVIASIPRIVEAAPGPGPLAGREPGATVVEAFRVLRTNLQFAAAGARLKTMLVTSPGAGEGKSTVASNLAAVLAQSGRRTLLIDADLRRPKQHTIFALHKKPGLTDTVMLGAPLESALHRAPAAPGAEGGAALDVLFAGTMPPSPVDFLNSNTFFEFLERMAAEYDSVVIDTPPVLVSADAAVVAARVDGVLLVSRMGRTDWRALAEAGKLLAQAGARLLGTVANDLKLSRGYGSYRYKYRYYHYRYQHAANVQ